MSSAGPARCSEAAPSIESVGEVWLCYFAGYMKGLRSAKVENPVRQGPNSRKEVPTTPTAPSLHS